jgi:hypothetical protein
MIIIYGSRFTGKVDAVGDLFHIETEFGHIYYIPLIPMRSYLVFEKSGGRIRGLPVSMNWKSVLVCYLRVYLGLQAMVTGIMLIAASQATRVPVMDIVVTALLLTASAAGFIWTYFMQGIGRASYERAIKIAQDAGLNEHGMIQIGAHYGKIAPTEAAALRANIAAARSEGAVVTMDKR